MKKIIKFSFIFVALLACLCMNSVKASEVNATVTPEYDATFNNNKGIFYANGNPITITKNSNDENVIIWDGGSQVVPNTVTIVGGGKDGTEFESSNITMNDGSIYKIFGGGISLDENKISKVKTSNVTINGGAVTTSLYGGGLIYTTTENANITINNGYVMQIAGGGRENDTINGVSYSAGTMEDVLNSKNRTINTNIIINGGTIDSEPSSYGLLYGGGQGYSYVENANITINDGDLSKAYVTAGGSNGYTKNANINVNGGELSFLQTVNRGIIEKSIIKISGGKIKDAYVGGEVEATVNGKISNIEYAVLGGSVENLYPGTSEGVALVVDQEAYKVITVKDVVTNNQIGEKKIDITYEFNILDDEINLKVNEQKKLNVEIKTTPEGYEDIFKDIEWYIEDEEIVKLDAEKVVTGLKEGETTIIGTLLEQQDTVVVNVSNDNVFLVILALLVAFALIAVIIILIS